MDTNERSEKQGETKHLKYKCIKGFARNGTNTAHFDTKILPPAVQEEEIEVFI